MFLLYSAHNSPLHPVLTFSDTDGVFNYAKTHKKALNRPLLRAIQGFLIQIAGSDLLSRPVARKVPSALVGLTAVFGMGTGVAPPLQPPAKYRAIFSTANARVATQGTTDSALERIIAFMRANSHGLM